MGFTMQDEKCISRRPQSRKKMKWGICPSMYVLMSMERLGHSEHCSYKKQPLCSYILFFSNAHKLFSLQAKRKLDLEDPLYLPEFRTPKGKCSIAARIPSPRSE